MDRFRNIIIYDTPKNKDPNAEIKIKSPFENKPLSLEGISFYRVSISKTSSIILRLLTQIV